MHKFSMKMSGEQRPVIDLYGNAALIDTGAIIPMVYFPGELLKLAWNAELVISDVEIGGIGGKTKGDIYTLHNFIVGDFCFDALDVFVSNTRDTRYTYLLSATMFYGTNFSFNLIDKENQTFTVEIPDSIPLHRDFRIKDLDGKIYAQVDGVLIQDELFPSVEITNYTQTVEYEFDDDFDIDRE